MSILNGASLLAKTIRLHRRTGTRELELTNGEALVWAGIDDQRVGRRLEASVKAGSIRNLRLPSSDGEIHEIHVGPDVEIIHEDDMRESRR